MKGSSRQTWLCQALPFLSPSLLIAKPQIMFLKLATKVYSLIWPLPPPEADYTKVQLSKY
ncbi:hypothetical protein I79_006247 [Cricetulus griseus]|uniref:Uncharacterized protein n=1 Tax=Cricetulus griseus TaxID=10029 RepID=G3H7B7_CRIGR|nr:hypothetical protein I79_006247 [Cricetulus griseus]